MSVINLTPHDITVRGPEGETIVLEASGTVARILHTEHPGAEPVSLGGFRVPARRHVPLAEGVLVHLPEPVEGITYVVSALCLDAAQRAGRTDVVAPGTGPNDGAIREGGRIIAITRLVRAV